MSSCLQIYFLGLSIAHGMEDCGSVFLCDRGTGEKWWLAPHA